MVRVPADEGAVGMIDDESPAPSAGGHFCSLFVTGAPSCTSRETTTLLYYTDVFGRNLGGNRDSYLKHHGYAYARIPDDTPLASRGFFSTQRQKSLCRCTSTEVDT